jgi:hypothetical protein
MNPQRILSEHDIDAMVAGDTVDLLVERVTGMVTAGRGMALAVRESTYTNPPVVLTSGWKLDTSARSGGVWVDRNFSAHDGQLHSLWCGIALTTGGDRYEDQMGFGFGESLHKNSGNATEREAWDRYHQHQAEHDDHFQRRRDMTHIAIIGGVPGRRYTAKDSITVSAWNRDGVCTEKVLGFDNVDGSW